MIRKIKKVINLRMRYAQNKPVYCYGDVIQDKTRSLDIQSCNC